MLFSLVFFACGSETVSQSGELLTGEEIYTARCSACHGPNLEGRVGPALQKTALQQKCLIHTGFKQSLWAKAQCLPYD